MGKIRGVVVVWLAAAVSVGFIGVSGAAAAGEFVPTGSMGEARNGASMVVLPDGKVLVAGGIDNDQLSPFLSSAEIYDPQLGTFTPTGSMVTPRSGAMAGLLDDGRVVVAGGADSPTTASISADIYDPATGTFTPTGSLGVARMDAASVMLSNGWLFAAGGTSSGFGAALATSTFFDRTGGINHTGLFFGSGSMSEARDGAMAVLLDGDRVLVAGGQFNFSTFLSTAEVWSRDSGQFTGTGSMDSPHVAGTASNLPGNKVLVAGGRSDPSTTTGSAEVYDAAGGTFSGTGGLATARYLATGTALADGRVLVLGGNDQSGATLASAEVYDPAQATFGNTGSMGEARWGASAVLLQDGRVLVAGGLNPASDRTSSAELFYPDGFPFDLTVDRDGSGSGTVTSNPAGINCGGDCDGAFARGTTVTLNASPASDSVFSGWAGACSGKGTCSVTMDEARSVTAGFDRKLRALSLKVVPGTRKVKSGGKSSFKAKVRNSGNVKLGPVKVCVKAPKKLVSVGKCISLGSLPGGQSKTSRFKVAVKPKSKKGKKVKLTFTASASGTRKATGTAKVKVK